MSETYNWNPELYKQSSSEQIRWALELLSKLKLKGNEHLLDIGCGDGKVTAKIAEMLSTGIVVGIDSSREMIDYARKSFPEREYHNLTFQVLSADSNTFQNEFDCVFSNAALHWVKDQKAVWMGIAQCLKSGGRALIQMAGKGNAQLMFDVLNDFTKQDKWLRYFSDLIMPYNFFGIEEYRKFIETSGMNIQRIELIPKDMLHNGIEGVKGWIKSVWLPYTERVPEDFKKDFIESLAEEYIKVNPPDKNGFVHSVMLRLEVEAVKPCKR
ncbi:MAG: class I SAM-dependent methyltransferase [Bacteroidetes bacterium]|nr:MAG: class I SAM-dependent methyltransferase [Bacteroidota bacterium]